MPSDGISKADLAARFGWSMAVLKSDKSLWRVFNKAVRNTWEPERFVAEVRNTRWFKKHSEAWRNASVLQKSDPATWRQRLNQTQSLIGDLGAQMGSQMSTKTRNRLAANALMFGWNDAQIRNVLAQSVKSSGGRFSGQAAVNAEELQKLSIANGVKLGSITPWLQRIAAGASIDTYEAYIRDQAASAFPTYAKELKAGMNMIDLAEPYRQAMAQTLEINAQDIDMFDSTIRRALQNNTPNAGTGGEAAPKGPKALWQFETDLKKDKRWLKTNNAQDEVMAVGRQVLADFGLVR